MGSTGTGNFTDYSNQKLNPKNSQGGSSGEDNCSKAFTTMLEEVETSQYFHQFRDVPEIGTDITLSLKSRVAVHDPNGTIIGYLPTKFNYIAFCIKDGHSYVGKVSSSGKTPIYSIQIDVVPII